MKRTGILLLLLALALPAPAAIYQCRDSKGNLFLTDDPDNLPPDCPPEEVTVREEEDLAGREPPSAEERAGGREQLAAPAPSARTGTAPQQSFPAVPAQPEAAPGATTPSAGERVGGPGIEAPATEAPTGVEGTPGRAERGESAAETGIPPAVPGAVPPAGTPGSTTVRGAEAQVEFEASLDRWRAEAAALGRQFLAAKAGTEGIGSDGGEGDLSAAARRREAQEQIDQFLDRLDASPLNPEEKAAVWRELPPEAIR